MPDQVLRYRVELDSASMMAQLASVEAQAGASLTNMVRPIQQATMGTFQTGVDNLTNATSMAMRANLSLPQAQGFFSQNASVAGLNPSLSGSFGRAAGLLPTRDYQYTPDEARYLYGQQFANRFESAGLSLGRAAGEMAGQALGSEVGWNAGSAIGRGLLGPVGGVLGGMLGANIGERAGETAYGAFGGAAIGGAVGGAVGGSVPLLGRLLEPLGTLAGATAGTVLGTAGQLITEQLGQRSQFRGLVSDIGGIAAPFGKSDSPLGTGYSGATIGKITDDLTKMASRDLRYSGGDYQQIIQAGAQAGAYDTAGTASKFTETTKDLVENVKLIQTALRKNLDESISVMQQLISMGIQNKGQVQQIVTQTRGAALTTGVSPDELVKAGMAATGLTKGTFFDSSGYGLGVQGTAAARYIRQEGSIRGPQGQDITAQVVASAGGEQQLGQDTARFLEGYMESGMGQDVLKAAYDPKTRTLNKDMLQRFSEGKIDNNRMMSMAARNMSNLTTLSQFEEDKMALSSELSPFEQRDLAMQSMNNAFKQHPLGRSESGRLQLFQQRASAMGMSEATGKGVWASLNAMPSMQDMEEQAGRLRPATSDDEAREVGPMGYLRRASRAFRGFVTDQSSDLVEQYYDPLKASVIKGFNEDILGFKSPKAVPAASMGRLMDAASTPYSEGSGDLRGAASPHGLLPSLFEAAGMSRPWEVATNVDRMQMRVAGVEGYLPGYGNFARTPTDQAAAAGTPIKDLGDGMTQVFQGSLAELRQAEASNNELLSTLNGKDAAQYAEYNRANPAADRVAQLLAAKKGDLQEYVGNLRFARGGAPSAQSLVYGVGHDLLGLTKEQLDKDPELRKAIAVQASGNLSAGDLDDLMKSGIKSGEIVSGGKIDEEAETGTRNWLHTVTRAGGVEDKDREDDQFRLTEAALDIYGKKPGTRENTLIQAGYGRIEGGRFVFNDPNPIGKNASKAQIAAHERELSTEHAKLWKEAGVITGSLATEGAEGDKDRASVRAGLDSMRNRSRQTFKEKLMDTVQGSRDYGNELTEGIYRRLEEKSGTGGFREVSAEILRIGENDDELRVLGKNSALGKLARASAGTVHAVQGGGDAKAIQKALQMGGLGLEKDARLVSRLAGMRDSDQDTIAAVVSGAASRKGATTGTSKDAAGPSLTSKADAAITKLGTVLQGLMDKLPGK